MHPTKPTLCVAAVAVFLAVAAAGCNAILGGGYTLGAGSVDSGVAGRGTDGSGPETSAPPGSDACAEIPASKPAFERACTGATCVPFNNASRNTRCDAGGTRCPTATPISTPVDSGPPDAGPADSGDLDADGDSGDDGGAADSAPPPPIDARPGLPSCFTGLTQGPRGGALPPNIIYATGSTAIQPYVARVAQVLESLGIASVVYLGAGSCFGVNAMLGTDGYLLRQIGKTATYYDPNLDSSGQVQTGTCAVDDPARAADLGISDVFPTTCVPALASQGLPNNLHDFFGPVQVMEMVVPPSSSETSISAEAAYMVWGFGAGSGVRPWTDPAFLLQRSATSGTENMIGAAIGLPPSQYVWSGVKNGGSTAVLSALENVTRGLLLDGGPGATQANIDSTIGILASDVADPQRQYVRPLAFQDVGESCGWYPDSTAASFDKKNVRDGHYPIWGPSHLIAFTDANGHETSSNVKTLIDAMNGQNAQVLQTLDIVQFYAKSHIVPTCAMHVSRASDGQDYSSYAPPTSCSCYYDYSANSGQVGPECVPCKTSADCASPASASRGATQCVLDFGIPPVGYCEPPGR